MLIKFLTIDNNQSTPTYAWFDKKYFFLSYYAWDDHSSYPPNYVNIGIILRIGITHIDIYSQ